MGRLIKDAKLDTREARRKLKASRAPYFRSIERGKSVGYRKSPDGGSWIARLYVGSGRYAEQRLGAADDVLDADGREVLSWSDAQRKAHEWFGRRLTEDTGEASVSPERLAVGHALDAYLAWYKANRKAYDDTKYNVDAHIRPALGAVELGRLTKTRIQRWHQELATAPARLRTRKGAKQNFAEAPATQEAARSRKVTANRNLTILKAALTKAHSDHRLSFPPVWGQVARFRNVETARPRFLEHHEAVRLVNACDPAFRSLVQAALVTGARYGELAGLRVDDYRSGKLHVRDSKSGKARWIALAGDGRALFDKLTAGRRADETMFLKPARSNRADGPKLRGWGDSHQQEPMERACERAAIEALGFHQLRHTYASLSLMSGMPLIVLARNLGHGDTRMVERHYGHLLQSYEDQMIEVHAPKFGFGDQSDAGADIVSIGRGTSSAA
jgi:integrase